MSSSRPCTRKYPLNDKLHRVNPNVCASQRRSRSIIPETQEVEDGTDGTESEDSVKVVKAPRKLIYYEVEDSSGDETPPRLVVGAAENIDMHEYVHQCMAEANGSNSEENNEESFDGLSTAAIHSRESSWDFESQLPPWADFIMPSQGGYYGDVSRNGIDLDRGGNVGLDGSLSQDKNISAVPTSTPATERMDCAIQTECKRMDQGIQVGSERVDRGVQTDALYLPNVNNSAENTQPVIDTSRKENPDELISLNEEKGNLNITISGCMGTKIRFSIDSQSRWEKRNRVDDASSSSKRPRLAGNYL